MGKSLLSLFLFLGVVSASYSQEGMSIGKGGEAPNEFSIFELESTDKGILIPRMTSKEIDAIAPSAEAYGLLVYNISIEGFMYFDGEFWKEVTPEPVLQALQLNGNLLSLIPGDGTPILLPTPTLTYDDAEYALYYNGNKISIANLSSGPEGDSDHLNEIQTLEISNDTIYLKAGSTALTSFVKLPASVGGGTDDQIISFDQLTNVLTLEDGGTVDLSSLAGGAGTDTDPTNELQDLSIKNDSILISDGKGIKLPASVTSEDDQTLSFDDATNVLTLENGGAVDLTKFLSGADDDVDSTNEIQNLTLKGDSVLISGGDGIKLPQGVVSTDDQALSFDPSTHTLSLEDGGDIDLSVYDNSSDLDTDATNEIQTLRYENDTLYLSLANKVKIAPASGGTDSQQLSLDETTNTLSLENSIDIDLSKYDQSADLDADPTNEIQTISFANDTIYLSQDGGKIKFSEQETDPVWETEKINYYTQSNVQTSGEASIHWDNLTDFPTDLDLDATDDFSGDYADLANQPTASLTDEQVPRWDGTNGTFVDGLITDDGSNVSVGGGVNASYLLFVNGKFGSAGINELSDRRLKKDIQSYETSLDKVCKLRAVTYEWDQQKHPERNLPDGEELGFIAQEVEAVFPELVTTDENGFKTVQYSRTVTVLLEAIKELNSIVSAQQETITDLKASVENLDVMNERMDLLQKQIQVLNHLIESQTDTAKQ